MKIVHKGFSEVVNVKNCFGWYTDILVNLCEAPYCLQGRTVHKDQLQNGTYSPILCVLYNSGSHSGAVNGTPLLCMLELLEQISSSSMQLPPMDLVHGRAVAGVGRVDSVQFNGGLGWGGLGALWCCGVDIGGNSGTFFQPDPFFHSSPHTYTSKTTGVGPRKPITIRHPITTIACSSMIWAT